ncbi:MAG: NAD(+) synthase [Coriobacteriia bacterium]|nr:NAD(+) synthase [Coriobacteriia bacterium]
MDAREKYQVCVDGLKAYAAGAGFTHMLVGLSGGIDSSVIATMCVDAFGPENVHGVLLPGPYSSDHSVSDAQDLADRLGIQVQTVSICEPYQAFKDLLGDQLTGLAAENTQARCRMVVLMALSNQHNWMLVNTGNKTEAYMGYSTLYGDTAGAYAPMGCLYKTDVFAVARWRNAAAEEAGQVPPIPEHVLIKPPSAELAPGQEDEKSLGLEYALIDRILMGYYEHALTPEQIAAESDDYDLETVQRIVRRAEGYAYKRAMEPPFPQDRIY